ncbi:MAG: glycine cleavage system protein GcvH [Mycobacteriales bacterium]|nr:MAG: glycine cleavage system protein GcvH [Pseudonocardiales bacterium]
MKTPDDLRYTAEHEWARASDDGTTLRLGITDFAQQQLGDVVFVSLPEVGAEVDSGAPIGEVESTKSVSDIYAPIAGTVTARNDELDEHPDLINADPYGAGWIVEIAVADPSAIDTMLDAAAYQGMVDPH